jgi:hypothetical protein
MMDLPIPPLKVRDSKNDPGTTAIGLTDNLKQVPLGEYLYAPRMTAQTTSVKRKMRACIIDSKHMGLVVAGGRPLRCWLYLKKKVQYSYI